MQVGDTTAGRQRVWERREHQRQSENWSGVGEGSYELALRVRELGGLARGRGSTGALGVAQPPVFPGRYRNFGTFEGKNQRAAARPASGGIHGVGATCRGGAIGPDPLPNPGGWVVGGAVRPPSCLP